MDRRRAGLLYGLGMTFPAFIPDWLPWWAVLAVLVPVALYALAFLAMPFSVLGLKGRLEGLEARLDEIQAEVRALALRLPERGMYLSEAPAPRPPIPPTAHDAPRPRPPERRAARDEAQDDTQADWRDRPHDGAAAPDPSAPPARRSLRAEPRLESPRPAQPGRIAPRLEPRRPHAPESRTDPRTGPRTDWPR